MSHRLVFRESCPVVVPRRCSRNPIVRCGGRLLSLHHINITDLTFFQKFILLNRRFISANILKVDNDIF